MEPLIGAIAGLATAVTALTGVYLRGQRQNGNGRGQVITELREIKGLLERTARERGVDTQELRREHQEILNALQQVRR